MSVRQRLLDEWPEDYHPSIAGNHNGQLLNAVLRLEWSARIDPRLDNLATGTWVGVARQLHFAISRGSTSYYHLVDVGVGVDVDVSVGGRMRGSARALSKGLSQATRGITQLPLILN